MDQNGNRQARRSFTVAIEDAGDPSFMRFLQPPKCGRAEKFILLSHDLDVLDAKQYSAVVSSLRSMRLQMEHLPPARSQSVARSAPLRAMDLLSRATGSSTAP
jgi:hypothetical protein